MPYSPDANQQVRDSLVSVMREALKLYRVYDVNNRLVTQYEAPTKAKDGDPCIRTDYAYDGTSPRIIKMKETMTAWSAVWDI